MTGQDRNHDREVRRVEDALIEDIIGRSDEEILAEVREDHGDIDAAVQRLRGLITKALTLVAKKKLQAAQAAVREARERSSALRIIPGSFEVKKKLLLSVIARQPAGSSPLTLAARNADELTESDVDGILQDLQDLGLIDERGNPK
ncbi:MAG TPA: hypothetical protein VMV19_18770 [Xanthobacteraceae bacterium]|nr:hypothetical protein [Xanthobacteraceae bacterium]